VNDQINKLNSQNIDTTEAKTLIATADTDLAEARAKTAEANAILTTSISQLSKDNKAKLQTLAQDTQTLIKEAHQSLSDAVKSLKNSFEAKKVNTSNSTETN